MTMQKMIFSKFGGSLLCMAYLCMMSHCVIGGNQKAGDVSRIKELYSKHYQDFQMFVLGLKKQVNDHWPSTIERGARWVKGYNEFTIACIPISFPFFRCDEEYVVFILNLVNEEYLDCIEHSLERCKQKPDNLKLPDWIAQVSHEEHINNITLPAGVQKERLIKDPKEYQNIINKVSPQERDALIAVGLFSRYLAERNLL